MKKITRSIRIWLGIVFVIVLIALRVSGIHNWFTLAWLHDQREALTFFIGNNPFTSACIYIGLYALAVTLALPLMSVMTIVGGFLFGVLRGAFYANVGATLGATIFFILVRFLVGSSVQRAYQTQLVRFNEHVDQFGKWYFLAVRCIAVIPFFVINLLAGLTTVSLWTFIWTTSLGIIPVSLVLAFAGTELASIHQFQDIFSFNILLALGALGVLGILSMVLQYVTNKKGPRGAL